MILWIASYPKSGNTWIRALISTYLYSDEGEFNFKLLRKIPKFTQEKYISPLVKLEELKKNPLEISKYWESAQLRINLDKEINFFKTHNACVAYKNRWFTNEINTIGYIYIVRDPRAIACSLASHTGITLEQSVNDLLNENLVGYNGPNKLAETPGSWKINYLSWKKKKKFNGIVIKYEDLIDNPEIEFKKIFRSCSDLMINIKENPKPVIAVIDGIATAAGCQLIASCDLAYASNKAKFATPGVNIGLFCSTPMVALSRNVNKKSAMEMLLTGEMINANKARQIGLINDIFSSNLLMKKVIKVAKKISSKSMATLKIGKNAFYKQREMSIEEAYNYTSAVMVENMLKNDSKEGINAFLEKREPNWDN